MRRPSAKHFQTTGPCDPERHYILPATPRIPEARDLIEMDRYFVLHAPRQTGKTTALGALASELTAAGDTAALLFSCEKVGLAGDDYAAAETILLKSIREAAARSGWPDELLPHDPPPHVPPGARFSAALSRWCHRSPRRVVLLFDDTDGLQGASMVSILSQLRAGHNDRPAGYPFPASVVLCGSRDVRHHKATSGEDPITWFNIVAASLRLGDFTADQIAELYGQHTEATGQEFTKDAVDRVFELTQGQPWLVNALAREIIHEMGVTCAITRSQVDEARTRLIQARAAHLDFLAARLHEPQVKRVMEPLIAGSFPDLGLGFSDALSYVEALGLVKEKPLEVANPIYREVILRALGDHTEGGRAAREDGSA